MRKNNNGWVSVKTALPTIVNAETYTSDVCVICSANCPYRLAVLQMYRDKGNKLQYRWRVYDEGKLGAEIYPTHYLELPKTNPRQRYIYDVRYENHKEKRISEARGYTRYQDAKNVFDKCCRMHENEECSIFLLRRKDNGRVVANKYVPDAVRDKYGDKPHISVEYECEEINTRFKS